MKNRHDSAENKTFVLPSVAQCLKQLRHFVPPSSFVESNIQSYVCVKLQHSPVRVRYWYLNVYLT